MIKHAVEKYVCTRCGSRFYVDTDEEDYIIDNKVFCSYCYYDIELLRKSKIIKKDKSIKRNHTVFYKRRSKREYSSIEKRICPCGCLKEFECQENSKKKWIRNHDKRNVTCADAKWKKIATEKMVLTLKNLYGSGKRISWNKGLTKEINLSLKRMSEKKIGRKCSAETKSKMSTSQHTAFLEGRKTPRNHIKKHKKGYFYSKKNQKYLWYDSSFELIAFQILESLIAVKMFKKGLFRIPYFFNNKQYVYIIDLFVEYTNGEKQLIEVKAKYMLQDLQQKAKIDAGERFAKEHYMNWSVWTEDTLFSKT